MKLEAQRAEEARIQAELDAQRALEEERIRLEQERKAAIEKEKREVAEQQLRVEQLHICFRSIKKLIDFSEEKDLEEKREAEVSAFLLLNNLFNRDV